MNTVKDLENPMYGAFTDINVWDSILSSEEVDMWLNCSNQNQGNVVSWKDSSQTIELKGFQQVNDSVSKICPNEISNHFMGRENLNFFDTFNYCQ